MSSRRDGLRPVGLHLNRRHRIRTGVRQVIFWRWNNFTDETNCSLLLTVLIYLFKDYTWNQPSGWSLPFATASGPPCGAGPRVNNQFKLNCVAWETKGWFFRFERHLRTEDDNSRICLPRRHLHPRLLVQLILHDALRHLHYFGYKCSPLFFY